MKANNKVSYTIPCSTLFRESILKLANSWGVNSADIARSILLLVPESVIKSAPDPGEPPRNDREIATMTTGKSAGKSWRRKPRLQMRLKPGYEISFIRRALNLAINIGGDSIQVSLLSSQEVIKAKNSTTKNSKLPSKALETISLLGFEPLKGGVKTKSDALYIFGYPPTLNPHLNGIRKRYRKLAAIYHPDNGYGTHLQMSQLNAAMDFFRKSQ